MATAMMDPNDAHCSATRRYTRVAIALHWLIAAAILYNLLSGLGRAYLPRGFFVLHISSGLTILALTVVRVVWRLTHKPPPLLPMKTWEARLAHGVHFLLYLAMLMVPWTGWVMISATPPAGSPGAAYAQAQAAQEAAAAGNPAPTPRPPAMFWGLFPVPKIGPVANLGRETAGVAEQQAFHEQMEGVHQKVALGLLFLFFLHIGGALKHQFIDREPELARMGLGGGRDG